MKQRIDKYQLFGCEGDPLLPSGGQSIEIQLIALDSKRASFQLVHIPGTYCQPKQLNQEKCSKEKKNKDRAV